MSHALSKGWSRYVTIEPSYEAFTEQRKGMNISMNVVYKLTLKLALILRNNMAKPSLLPTYQHERQYIAQHIVDFDEKFSHMSASSEKLQNPDFHDIYVQNSRSSYRPSDIEALFPDSGSLSRSLIAYSEDQGR